MSHPADRTLLRRASRGDADAYAAFFRRHERAVVGYAVAHCSSPDEVADAVAETFLVALRHSGRFDDDAESARPWLLGIAHKVVAGQRRQRARHLRLGRRAALVTPRYAETELDAIHAAIDARRGAGPVNAAVAALPAAERAVLTRVAEDLDPGEVATELGVTANAARLRLSRARRRVRDALESRTEEGSSDA